jgi:hypothetical protein
MIEEGRIFSCPDEYGEERYYCVTEILPSEYYEALFSAQGEAVKAMRAAKKASKAAWEKSMSGFGGNKAIGRANNSPMMLGVNYEPGSNALMRKISRKSPDFLRKQAGTSGKMSAGKQIYGGNWAL